MLDDARIIGSSLDDLDEGAVREAAPASCEELQRQRRRTLGRVRLDAVVRPAVAGPQALAEAVHAREAELADQGEVRRVHDLSVLPKAALAVVHMLEEAGLRRSPG